jgi:hypothetical protein
MVSLQDESATAPGTTPPGQSPPSNQAGDAMSGPAVDVDALAQRVFALLKRELVIERERTGRSPLL